MRYSNVKVEQINSNYNVIDDYGFSKDCNIRNFYKV